MENFEKTELVTDNLTKQIDDDIADMQYVVDTLSDAAKDRLIRRLLQEIIVIHRCAEDDLPNMVFANDYVRGKLYVCNELHKTYIVSLQRENTEQ